MTSTAFGQNSMQARSHRLAVIGHYRSYACRKNRYGGEWNLQFNTTILKFTILCLTFKYQAVLDFEPQDVKSFQ